MQLGMIDVGEQEREADAETTPLEHYQYDLDFADRVLSAMRFEFGGHEEKSEG
jgi:hypothetical protein